MGHNNDAETFRMMTPIGVGRVLALLRDCYLLDASIYPSRHLIVTPFSSAQLRRQPENIKRHWKKIKWPRYRRVISLEIQVGITNQIKKKTG
jgi:hypothetical protein